MTIKSLIFDFDGLILDTETPDLLAWQEIYAGYGLTFPVESWGRIIGGAGASQFDAAIHLEELIGQPLDLTALRARQNNVSHTLVGQQPVLPGVIEFIREARHHPLKMAIASSSPHSWVDAHLARLGLRSYFDKIICADDVAPGRTKPNPDLFLKALEWLKVGAEEAVVFEDSPNGVRAARAAGIFVVAVPNPTTALLTFEGEDLRLNSFTDLSLSALFSHLK
jgi:HAD superfamily hydrolase (TIGR01509 family)